MKNRIFYYDFLRAIAIIAVIMCHVNFFFGDYSAGLPLIFHSLFHGFGLIGVPIFLMLTGALLLNKNDEPSIFLKKRFSRIMIPFIFWIIIIMAIGLFYLKWNLSYAYNVFIGNGSIIWYLWMLVGIYLFIPVLTPFFNTYKLKGAKYFLIIWFFTIICQTFNFWPIFPDYPLNTNFELNYFASFIGYAILGYYLANEQHENELKLFVIGILLFIISISSYVYCDINTINRGPLYLNIINVVMALSFFLIIKYASKLNLFEKIKNSIFERIIVSISIFSYGMYFSHYILIKCLKQLDFHSNKFIIPWLIIIIALSWLIIFILSKIPYIKKVCGI